MNNNLVPEVRVDKRGVAVTRHVKQQTAGGNKTLPAVSIAPAQKAANKAYFDNVNHITSKMTDYFGDGYIEYSLPTREEFTEALSGLSDDTVRLVRENLGTAVPTEDIVPLLHSGEFTETDLREYMVFSSQIPDSDDYGEIVGMIRGLRSYPSLQKHADLTQASPDVQESCKALLRLTYQYHYNLLESNHGSYHEHDGPGDSYPVLNYPSLVSLVVKNPNRAQAIAGYIEDSGHVPIKQVKSMVENTHAATQDGWL